MTLVGIGQVLDGRGFLRARFWLDRPTPCFCFSNGAGLSIQCRESGGGSLHAASGLEGKTSDNTIRHDGGSGLVALGDGLSHEDTKVLQQDTTVAMWWPSVLRAQVPSWCEPGGGTSREMATKTTRLDRSITSVVSDTFLVFGAIELGL